MLANVNATRMQLLYLRKKVALARRGHRLLSEKRDEISRQLIRIARQIRPLRKRVEAELMETCQRFMLARMEGEIICYGYATTSGELDVALLALERAFDSLIELAEKEKQARLLATELQMTRRRVNVLEHVVIPELDETIRFIFDKLAEAERDNTSRLMKITDIIRA
ncbi:MAG: V-type ATP synthase subunit D [Planctomycetota bacterium]|jgi:V/A-type H+-transporting ATPase subunit D